MKADLFFSNLSKQCIFLHTNHQSDSDVTFMFLSHTQRLAPRGNTEAVRCKVQSELINGCFGIALWCDMHTHQQFHECCHTPNYVRAKHHFPRWQYNQLWVCDRRTRGTIVWTEG